MAWVIAVGGIIMLIVLHEAGHFFAAKAVGMRVERFSLFFPPTIAKFKRGETEYALGSIPAGGYVKITGMSPEELEELDPTLAQRAYYTQKPWKRIVVILAGPGMNLLIALVIFTAVLWSGNLGGANTIGQLAPQVSTLVPGTTVYAVGSGSKLQVDDRIVAVDGRRATGRVINTVISRDACVGTPESSCRAARPVMLTVERGGSEHTIAVYPQYQGNGGMMIGVSLSGTSIASLVKGYPAFGVLRVGDRILTADGRRATANDIIDAIHAHSCKGTVVVGCRATTPVILSIRRAGADRSVAIYPRYVKPSGSMMVDALFARARPFSLVGAVGAAGATMWSITTSTVTGLVHALTSAKARSHLSGIIGITQVTEQAVAAGPVYGFVILGLVSMILGVLNLFPFLPLDGGHVLWSVTEKLRGARVSTASMWRFSSVGIVLLLFLVVTAMTNNVVRLAGG